MLGTGLIHERLGLLDLLRPGAGKQFLQAGLSLGDLRAPQIGFGRQYGFLAFDAGLQLWDERFGDRQCRLVRLRWLSS